MTLPTYAAIAVLRDNITVGVNASNQASGGTSWAARLAAALGAALIKGVSRTVLQNSADSSGAARANNERNSFQADVLATNRKPAIISSTASMARATPPRRRLAT